MRNSKTMRAAVLLLALTLITSCFVGGTFAKYTTSVNSSDNARVAKWGFTSTSIDISGLFNTAYDDDNGMLAAADAIAPGTKHAVTFAFNYDNADGINAPEVAYSFTVDVQGTCSEWIQRNPGIHWYLDGEMVPSDTVNQPGSFGALVTAVKKLSGEADGSKNYGPNELPEAFNGSNNTHTIGWEWSFGSTWNTADTMMGNTATDHTVSLDITVTATQLDTLP